jgi:hypothetical protein
MTFEDGQKHSRTQRNTMRCKLSSHPLQLLSVVLAAAQLTAAHVQTTAMQHSNDCFDGWWDCLRVDAVGIMPSGGGYLYGQCFNIWKGGWVQQQHLP